MLGTETSDKRIVRPKAKIVLSIDEIIYVHVMNATKDAWENLEKVFEDNGLTRKVGLLRKITTTKLERVRPKMARFETLAF